MEACAAAIASGLVEVDVQDKWGSTALMHAVNKKHTPLVHYLLSKGADINKQDYRGITCLMEASWNRHLDMVRLLLKAGANINLTDERDYTALMQAAEEGHHTIVQVLIEAGVDLNRQEKKRNYTALMWSVVEGHPSVVQYLVQAGACLNVQDKVRLTNAPGRRDGVAALIRGKSSKKDERTCTGRSLCASNADFLLFILLFFLLISSYFQYGFTALMQAARTRFLAAVLLLVGNGADLDIKDKKNRTVYDLGNQQVLQAIEKGKRELRRKYITIFAQDRGLSQLHPDTLNIIGNYLVATV